MSELEPTLLAKFPKMNTMGGISPAGLRCGATDGRCIQMEKSGCTISHQGPEGWVITEIPEVPNAGGCSECPNNSLNPPNSLKS